MNKQDKNLIVTIIKCHPLSLSYAFLRAAKLIGVSKSKVSYVYYSELRHTRKIFCIKTDEVEIWNQKRKSKWNQKEQKPRI